MKKLLITVLMVVTATAAAHAQHGHILGPGELVEAMQKSNTSYVVKSSPDDSIVRVAISNMFATQRQYTPYPRITQTPDGPTVTSYSWNSEAFDRAEKAFAANNYQQALEGYIAELAINPKDYIAIEDIGDCYYHTGKPDSAIMYYDKAIALNKLDYQPYLYKADVLYHMKRYEDARQAAIDALTLRPRYINTRHMLHNMPLINRDFRDSNFAPHAYAVKNGKDVVLEITSDTMISAWMGYAIGKAIWLGEPWHRDSLTGSSRMSWTMSHEVECFASLMSLYESERATKRSTDLERLDKIVSDDLLNAFILYEIGSRLDQDIMLTVDDNVRQNVRIYVEKYILPKS